MAKTENKASTRAEYYQLEAELDPRAGNPGRPLSDFLQEAKKGMAELKKQRPVNWRGRKSTAG